MDVMYLLVLGVFVFATALFAWLCVPDRRQS